MKNCQSHHLQNREQRCPGPIGRNLLFQIDFCRAFPVMQPDEAQNEKRR